MIRLDLHKCAFYPIQVLTDEDDENSLLQQLNIAMGDDEEREAEQDDDKESSLAESSTRSELGESECSCALVLLCHDENEKAARLSFTEHGALCSVARVYGRNVRDSR